MIRTNETKDIIFLADLRKMVTTKTSLAGNLLPIHQNHSSIRWQQAFRKMVWIIQGSFLLSTTCYYYYMVMMF